MIGHIRLDAFSTDQLFDETGILRKILLNGKHHPECESMLIFMPNYEANRESESDYPIPALHFDFLLGSCGMISSSVEIDDKA